MNTSKIEPSELEREAQRPIREGKMPTLEDLLTVIAEVREKYAPHRCSAKGNEWNRHRKLNRRLR